MLEIDFDAEGRVRLRGRLDATQAAAAQAFLDRIEARPQKLTVDCAGLDYVASAGLGVLLKTHKRLLAAGGGLRLKAPGPHLRDILVFSGFDHVFEVEA